MNPQEKVISCEQMESSSQIIVRFCNLLQKVPTTQRSFKIDKVSSRECYIYKYIIYLSTQVED